MALLPDVSVLRFGDALTGTAARQPSLTYAVDFERGTIRGRIDGTDAMRQALHKMLHTERYTAPIYSGDYGVELDSLIGKSHGVAESEAKRIIAEALTVDDRVASVRGISYTPGARDATVECTVDTIYGEQMTERSVTVNV